MTAWLVDLIGSGLALVGAGLALWFTRPSERRSASLRRLLSRVTAAWVVAYGSITALFPGLIDNWLLLMGVVWSPLFVLPALTWRRRVKEAGESLLTVRSRSSPLIMVSAVALGMVTPSAVSLLYPTLAGADRLALLVLMELLPLAGVIHTHVGLRIAENGILGYHRYVPWESVESFRWYEKPRLRLVVRAAASDSDTPITSMPYEEWTIPVRRRDAVAELLRERIPELESSGTEDIAFFRERYGRGRSEVARRVERRVLGDEVGLNGYTTVEQARRLRECLDLSPSSWVLDVGSGRGWPGVYISEACDCRVVLSDIPVEALRQAHPYTRARGVEGLVTMVCADGRDLPFRRASFDAVVHADVFC